MHTEWVAHSITPLLGEAMPLIHKWKYAEDPYHTFRVDPANAVIRVTYEDYPGQSFDDHCGLLYYDKALTDYRVRVTYRFREPQAKNPVSWGWIERRSTLRFNA